MFIDLRDRSGILQLVFHPETAPEAHALAQRLRSEHVISVAGEVVRREEGNVNPKLRTGEIELSVADAQTPGRVRDAAVPARRGRRGRRGAAPAPPDARPAARADAGRRSSLRHTITRAMRDYLNAHDFLDIETPILTRSTPEGARDFLVPARSNPGAFYALPQSPQLFKQLLMMSGYERYYQIARCFRDEELRADRQPEFTQLDLEMSFVEEDDVIGVIEGMLARVFEEAGFEAPPPPWPRMGFAEAMARFGTDRPDTRFGLEIQDLGDAVAGSEFKVFSGTLGSGGAVRGLNAGAREVPRKDLDALTELVKRFGAGGLVWAFVQEDGALALAGRPSSSPTTSAPAIGRAAQRPARRPAADRRRQARRSPRRRSASCGWSSRAASTSSRGPPRAAVGRRLPDVRVERGGGALGRPAPPVHRAASARSTTRARCAAAATTSCSTARRSAAGRSVSTAPTSSSRSSRRSASPRRRPRRASGSCWKRCVSAPRRTAASRSASTASWRCSAAATRSAT